MSLQILLKKLKKSMPRGGKRKGAGRKPAPNKTKYIAISIPEDTVKRLREVKDRPWGEFIDYLINLYIKSK